MSIRDQSDILLDAVHRTREAGGAVAITGSGSKGFLWGSGGGEQQVRMLSTADHTGIVDYRPAELVVTALSGTPLPLLRQTLAREGQMLAFDPPEFRGLGTIGGAVAAGLCGPGRLAGGRVRDSVLGVVMVNGLGERLRFGGQVMKNVAGFDVSRLQAGAFGLFGLLLEVSLRCIPMPTAVQTRQLEVTPEEAIELMTGWARRPLPIAASAYEDGVLRVRLAGAERAVDAHGAAVGGERLVEDDYWNELRDQRRPLFRSGPIGVRQLPPAVPVESQDRVIEWGGARRWRALSGEGLPDGVIPFDQGYARRICWHAGGNGVVAEYQRRLKKAFDPDGLFNPEICDAHDPA